ncbi:MAG: hypothetical protein P8N43_08220 [Alphaproteobacteria bacterium]|nr:hypothetical protein [Alphaproteobacteria bacterium]
MADDLDKLHELRAADPGDVYRVFSQDNLRRLANAVSPHLAAQAQTLVYVLSMPSRIGHLALEPRALFNLYDEKYDQLIVMMLENENLPPSAGVTELASHYVRFANTPDPEIVDMGHYDGDIQDFGIFSFAIASPQGL